MSVCVCLCLRVLFVVVVFGLICFVSVLVVVVVVFLFGSLCFAVFDGGTFTLSTFYTDFLKWWLCFFFGARTDPKQVVFFTSPHSGNTECAHIPRICAFLNP